MDFNTFIIRFGFDPECFVNRYSEPVKTDEGFVYEVEQKTESRACPYCQGNDTVIHDHRFTEINCSSNDHIRDTLRIKKVRLLCRTCGRTFTPPLSGIERYSKTSSQTIGMISKDFFRMLSFSRDR